MLCDTLNRLGLFTPRCSDAVQLLSTLTSEHRHINCNNVDANLFLQTKKGMDLDTHLTLPVSQNTLKKGDFE